MPKAVICTAKTQSQAQPIVNRLEHAGIAPDNISIVMSDYSGRYGHAANSEALLGLLKGVGRIVLPKAGFFIAAGPILSAIHDTPQSTLEGVAGALMNFGLPEYDACHYQDKVKAGAVLISFHTPDNDETRRIHETLDNTDAQDILITGEEDLADMDHYLRSRSS